MLYPEGRYNLNFDICSLLLCGFILAFFAVRKDIRARRIRLFLWVVFTMLLSSCGELATDLFRNGSLPFVSWKAEFVTALSHFSHNSVPFLLVLYFLTVTGVWHGMTAKQLQLLAIPEVVLFAVHLIAPIRRLIYYYTPDGHYVTGPLYSIYTVIVLLYVIYCTVNIILHWAAIRSRDRIYIIVLGIGFLGSMVLGYAKPYLRATNFLQTLFMLGSFIALENDDILMDTETGIYNAQAMARDAAPLFQSRYSSQIIGIKIQHFNYYRLMLGLNAMTQLLHEIGAWMKSISSGDVTFYRVSHGEFAVILFNQSEEKAHALAERIRGRFADPWRYSGNDASIALPAQIWISSIPDRMKTEEQLIVFAESSFNDALPKDRIYVADEMKEQQRRVSVDIAVRRALKDNTLMVYYQPIYDTGSGKIHSCEALVRMNDPELGFVSPEEFIKVAEQTGTISQIGTIVFEKVCRFIAEKDPASFGLDFIEVNLSTIQCMDENLVQQFQAIMKRYGVSPSSIVLEITESAVIHNQDRMQQIVSQLKNAGFSFALDDFGTGHANYSYVMDFPFRIIKIDKSFLWSADKSEASRIILRNMLDLVRALRLETVVEGVETEQQRDMLIQAGVAYLQGYYYSKPVPEDQFVEYVKNFNK